MFEARVPTHLRLSGEERKRFMSRYKEPMPDFRPGFRGIVERLIIKVLVRLRANEVTAHRVPVILRRSSSLLCFSSQ